MSIKYIIDGYNVLKQMPEYTGKKLKQGRDELIRLFKIQRPQGSLKNEVIIVFDGISSNNYIDDYLTNDYIIEKQYNLKIIFTKKESADNRIKNIVIKSDNPRNIIVVTDDKELRQSVRINGAKVLNVKEFIKPIIKTNKKSFENPKKELDLFEKISINKELEKIWLK